MRNKNHILDNRRQRFKILSPTYLKAIKEIPLEIQEKVKKDIEKLFKITSKDKFKTIINEQYD